MAKKSFTGGINSLIQDSSVAREEQPVSTDSKKIVRANFVMDISYHKNLKIIAAKTGLSIKDVLSEALCDYFEKNSNLLH